LQRKPKTERSPIGCDRIMPVLRGPLPNDEPNAVLNRERAAELQEVQSAIGASRELAGEVSTVCAKVNPFLERVYSADRALHPLRRIGAKGEGRFERVSWDEALADIASRMKEAIAKHGPTTVLPYSFAGSQGLLQFASLDRRFFSLLGRSLVVLGMARAQGCLVLPLALLKRLLRSCSGC
jgi:Molybdopterin oxidoreductase